MSSSLSGETERRTVEDGVLGIGSLERAGTPWRCSRPSRKYGRRREPWR